MFEAFVLMSQLSPDFVNSWFDTLHGGLKGESARCGATVYWLLTFRLDFAFGIDDSLILF